MEFFHFLSLILNWVKDNSNWTKVGPEFRVRIPVRANIFMKQDLRKTEWGVESKNKCDTYTA